MLTNPIRYREKTITVVGAPFALGQPRPGVEQGPAYLRQAGLIKELNEPIFTNPVILEQSQVDIPFVPHPFLGHDMPAGREFIGQKHFLNWDDVIKEIKKSGKKVVLNLGDSSTSGWDSDVVTENKQNLNRYSQELHSKDFLDLAQSDKNQAIEKINIKSAFFNYNTYSDCLRELIGDSFTVLNAGVPAHTSLQGRRKLQLLLERFSEENIKIDCITVYYGNNDSVWDSNREDKDWLSLNENNSNTTLTHPKTITRVNLPDFQVSVEEIIGLCLKYQVLPILVKPLVPLYWEPGTRVKGEKLPMDKVKKFPLVYTSLQEAHETWTNAIKMGFSNEKIRSLELAKEKDYIVPRIKDIYVESLRIAKARCGIDLVDIAIPLDKDDGIYFNDYCHPIEPANIALSAGIADVISQWENKRKTLADINNVSALVQKVESDAE